MCFNKMLIYDPAERGIRNNLLVVNFEKLSELMVDLCAKKRVCQVKGWGLSSKEKILNNGDSALNCHHFPYSKGVKNFVSMEIFITPLCQNLLPATERMCQKRKR